jgi:hypothetical protein
VTEAFAYTSGGVLSAALLGAVLGWLGRVIASLGGVYSHISLWLLTGIAIVLLARDLNWLPLSIPDGRCQTPREWQFQFGLIGIMMWGFHLGLGFATYVTYSGYWLVLAGCIAIGQPEGGVLLLVAYWLGRSASVWLFPALIAVEPEAKSGLPAPWGGSIWMRRKTFQKMHIVGLILSGLIILLHAIG